MLTTPLKSTGHALLQGSRLLLFLGALTPLLVVPDTLYGFKIAKMIGFRTIVELALASLLGSLIAGLSTAEMQRLRAEARRLFRHPVFLSLVCFSASASASTVFALSPTRSLWGTLERGDGLFDLLHYVLFVALAVLNFRKKDWDRFLVLTLCAGALVLIYGTLQYAGVSLYPLPSAHSPRRTESLIGNGAMLATYLILLITVSSQFYFKSADRLRACLAAGTVSLSVLLIFTTGTRGALVGLATSTVAFAAYLAAKKPSASRPHVRRIALILLVLLVGGGATLYATRTARLWGGVPGVNRLLPILDQGTASSTAQVRLRSWQLSIDAFKTRPVLGWGLENYIFAWSRHYDPAISIHADTWLDKPHNKVMEVLVQQGVTGICAYAAIFIALFHTLWRWQRNQPGAGVTAAGLSAYLVSLLFLFDDVHSYVLLFTILAVSIETSKKTEVSTAPDERRATSLVMKGAFATGAVALLYSLYAFHYIPFYQARQAGHVRNLRNGDAITESLSKAFYPYSYAQPSIRGNTIDYFYRKHPEVHKEPSLRGLSEALLRSLEEVIEREPYYDARMHVRQDQIYGIRAVSDGSALEDAEKAIREALRMAPNRPEIYYSLSRTLARRGRLRESEKIARQAVELEPRVARAHFNLGLALALGHGKQSRQRAEEAFEAAERLDPGYRRFIKADLQNLATVYLHWRDAEKTANLVRREIEKGRADSFEYGSYGLAMQYFIAQRDTMSVLLAAEAVASRFQEKRDDMELLIDLVEKGRWEVAERHTRQGGN